MAIPSGLGASPINNTINSSVPPVGGKILLGGINQGLFSHGGLFSNGVTEGANLGGIGSALSMEAHAKIGSQNTIGAMLTQSADMYGTSSSIGANIAGHANGGGMSM